MTEIHIFTDGSCLGNPGVGGYCAILRAFKDGILIKEKIIKGAEKYTTNNRMELKAVIEALKEIKRPNQKIIVHTDSQYVANGIRHWLKDWAKKDFKDVKNDDLWRELYDVLSNHDVDTVWLKSHQSGRGEMHDTNNLCDKIAREEAIKLKENL